MIDQLVRGQVTKQSSGQRQEIKDQAIKWSKAKKSEVKADVK
jgi:hypothetical protein